jgi:molybdopterin molybdotransferase
VDPLISLAEADQRTAGLPVLGRESVTLAEALGRCLAAPLAADRDFPPYPRAMMDGIAFAAATLPASGPLLLAGLHAAGDPPPPPLPPGQAWEIMTGAMVPADCDTVVPYEDLDHGRPRPGFRPGQFIHASGSDASAGSRLVAAGRTLGPVEIAIAASLGLDRLDVFRHARIALLTTGDEAVPPGIDPLPWQIRRSNGPMLDAMLRRRGNPVVFHDHAPDDPAICAAMLAAALRDADLLLVCGGISKGRKDHVRPLLEALLGPPAFHGVAQRPGKPLACWTGPPPVFALPGNPVSVLATFTRHVLPALARMEGQAPVQQRIAMSGLPAPLPKFSWLLTVAPGPDGILQARPPANSGDFISVADCTGLVELPPAPLFDPAARLPFHPFP